MCSQISLNSATLPAVASPAVTSLQNHQGKHYRLWSLASFPGGYLSLGKGSGSAALQLSHPTLTPAFPPSSLCDQTINGIMGYHSVDFCFSCHFTVPTFFFMIHVISVTMGFYSHIKYSIYTMDIKWDVSLQEIQ